MKIAVIGAGVTGLATAKVLSSRGHDVTVFEQRATLGGVWQGAHRYVGLKIQSPRQIYEYSDFYMPNDYPEYPSAEQVARHLDAYAEKFGLKSRARFNTRVTAMRPLARGWQLLLASSVSGGDLPAEDFEHVVLCNGLFEKPDMPEIDGRAEFESAGGSIIHSSAFSTMEIARGKNVVVVGFGKSAIDIATEANRVAANVALVFRRTAWHVPSKMFGVLSAKNFAYARSAEFWHGRNTTGIEGFVHRRMPWLVRLYWAMSQAMFSSHLGLGSPQMRPPRPLRECVGPSLGFLFPDNLAALREGKVAMVKGSMAKLSPKGVTLDDGQVLRAELVVLATGFEKDLAILPSEYLSNVVTPQGDYRLYRNIVPPSVPGLFLNGYNGTTAVPLTSEVAAHWIARWIEGLVAPVDQGRMNAVIDEDLAWRRAHLGGNEQQGYFTAPLAFRYLDILLADMGFPPADAKRSALSRFRTMLNSRDYAFLSASH